MKKTLQKINTIALVFAVAFAMVAPVASVSAQSASACTVYVRDLTLGSTGSDVVALQTFLQEKGHLTIPAGVSKGYFGELTRAALGRYQASQSISPTAGYFGSITRANVNIACAAGGGTIPTNPGNNNDDDLSGGEASLEAFDISSGDDSDVREGSTADIAEIEFDVEDGDVLINRIDIQLVADDANEEKDPWDTFDSIRIMIDGKEIAEKDISDEDEYLDEDNGTLRFSNIKYKVDEGETATMIVEIEAQKNVDGADSGDSTWTINVLEDGIRATDAEGIQQYVGDDSETVSFEVVSQGEDDELDVSSSSEDPDSTTLKVEDNKKSDEHAIFAFDLQSGDADVEIDTVQVVLESDVSVSNVISDLILEIDGEQFDDWSFVGTGTSTRTVEFDIDGDYTLDADDEVTAVLIAEFKSANGSNYNPGATIQASIEDGAIEGEGADDVVSEGTASGETHTLEISGIVIDKSGFSDEGSEKNNDGGTSRDFKFTFDVEAFEEDFYVATSSVNVFVEGAGSATVTYTVTSTGDEDTNDIFTVEEGETETFTVVVTVSNVSVNGQYRVGLDSVDYTENSNGVSGTVTKDVNDSDFRTAYATVNN